MTPIVYRQIDLVDRCFLIEAVWWVGLCRAPETAWTLDGKEWRFDEGSNNAYEANPFDEMVTNVECEFAKLPPNPEYQALVEESDDYSGSLMFLEKFINMVEGEERKEIEGKLNLARIFDEKCKKWQREYDKYIELPKTQIFLALREGKLPAFGRPLTHQNVDDATTEIERNLPKGEHWSWQDIAYKEIPVDFWKMDSVLWETSAALDGISHYMHICVDVKTLLDLFPIDEEERENVVSTDGTVKAAAGQLFWLSDGITRKPNPIRSGRPPIVKWDEFLVEVTRRLQNNEVPEKQEAFVLDMRQWCWKKWGRAPARSTVIQKISPYHKMFIRKKSESP